MHAETIKMSSRGQIVIPQDIREELKASEGTIFSVVSAKDTIILKKLLTPSKEDLIKELGAIALDGRKRVEKLGKVKGLPVYLPQLRSLNMDNAAMIGVAAYYKVKRGEVVEKLEELEREARAKL